MFLLKLHFHSEIRSKR